MQENEVSSDKGDLLVVDDTPNNLRLLLSALGKAGYDVRCVTSGAQALKVVRFDPPDLILLDIKMPQLDGYEVCHRLKSDPQTCKIPVIFLSALDEAIDKVKAFEVGGADYVAKPFQIAEVIARIQHQLTILRLSRQEEAQYHRLQEQARELERTNEELEFFSYSMSHDLQAPLRSLQNMAYLLSEGYGDALDRRGQELVQRMMNSAKRINLLIEDLLEYTRLGAVEIEFSPVSLEVVAERVIEDLAAAIAEQEAEIEIIPPLPGVKSNTRVLIQVLSNLVSNAIKYVATGVKPKVTIAAQQMEDKVCLWVEDNGIGIDPEYREQIFVPFKRLHSDKTYPGTGIGLAIVKRGVERLGGEIRLESGAEGTRFGLELPAGIN